MNERPYEIRVKWIICLAVHTGKFIHFSVRNNGTEKNVGKSNELHEGEYECADPNKVDQRVFLFLP
jgi:hypothetical protein